MRYNCSPSRSHVVLLVRHRSLSGRWNCDASTRSRWLSLSLVYVGRYGLSPVAPKPERENVYALSSVGADQTSACTAGVVPGWPQVLGGEARGDLW